MPLVVDRDFLAKNDMTEDEFTEMAEIAKRGKNLYAKYHDFIMNKEKTLCECGKLVAHTRQKRHLKTAYHQKRVKQMEFIIETFST